MLSGARNCTRGECTLPPVSDLRPGDRFVEAHALTDLGCAEERLGRYQQAADHHNQALAMFRQAGDRNGEAEALNGLGEALLGAALPGQARTEA